MIWGGAALLCFMLKALVPVPAVGQIALAVPVGGVAMLLFLRSGAIAQSDREILANLMHGRESALLRRLGLAPGVAPTQVV